MTSHVTSFLDRHPNHTIRMNKLGVTCLEKECGGEFEPWSTIVEEYEASGGDQPDGWIFVHHRASGSSSCYFGPFRSVDEAAAFRQRHQGVHGAIIPVYLTVDWSR